MMVFIGSAKIKGTLTARPAGIFTQSSMRIEKGFLTYGHDLDSALNPFEAGLDFAIDWNSEFIGKQALLIESTSLSRLLW